MGRRMLRAEVDREVTIITFEYGFSGGHLDASPYKLFG